MIMYRRQVVCTPGAPKMLKYRREALFFETVQDQDPLLRSQPSKRHALTATSMIVTRLANDAPAIHAAQASRSLLLFECVPEAERLIACAGDNDLAIRAHGQVENTVGVAGQRNDLLHTWVFPDNDLVLTVTMSRDNFVAIF